MTRINARINRGELRLAISEARARFFDRELTAHLGNRLRSAYARAGSYCMKVARRSIRDARRKRIGELRASERKSYEQSRERLRQRGLFNARNDSRKLLPLAPSKPGEPPRSITKLLRRFIFFAWDQSTQSVVIGPAQLNKSTGAPKTLEYGGKTSLVFTRSSSNNRIYQFRRRIYIKPRPYMRPALAKTITQMDRFWK